MKEENESLVQKSSQEEDSEVIPTEITDIIGHGRWQLWICLISAICLIPKSWNTLGNGFLAFPKDYECLQPHIYNITATTEWHTVTSSVVEHGKQQWNSKCEQFVSNSSVNGTVITMTEPCTSWVFEPGYKSIVEEFNLICGRDWLISISQSIYMLGVLCTSLFSGQVSDIYGRHPTIMLNLLILLLAGFSTAFSTSYMTFVVSRFFVAVGHAGLSLTTFVMIVEVFGSKYRAQAVIACGFGWRIGYLLLPLFAWLLQDWFYLQLIITAPCILYVFFYWFLPESPRWLLSSNKVIRANEVLRNAACVNKKNVTDIQVQVRLLYSRIFKSNESKSSATVIDLLWTPNLRKKTLSLYFIWLSIAFSYYGLFLNTNNLQGDIYWNFFYSGFVEIPGSILCMLTIDRYGRKMPFMIFLMLGGIACLSCIFIREDWHQAMTSLVMSGKFCIHCSFEFLYVYSAEIFPTVARNVGVGSCSTIARIGSSVAPFMRDLAKVTSLSVPLALFGILSISGFLVMLLPETLNHPVPETLNQAEKFGKPCEKTSRKTDMNSVLKSLM